MDNNEALQIVIAILSVTIALIGTLFWKLWATLATKTDLDESEKRIVDSDYIQDEKMSTHIGYEIKKLHEEIIRSRTENIARMDRIEDILLRRNSHV